MPVDNALHKAAHRGDLDECKKCIEGDPEDPEFEIIDVNEAGAADRRALVYLQYIKYNVFAVYLLSFLYLFVSIDPQEQDIRRLQNIS